MAALIRGALYFASAMGLGATIERWFGVSDEGDSLGIMKYLRLILIGGIVYFVFKLIGKKIPK